MTRPIVYGRDLPLPPPRPERTLRWPWLALLGLTPFVLAVWLLLPWPAHAQEASVRELAERHFPAYAVPWVMRTARCESGLDLYARSSGYDSRWRVYYDFRGPLQVDAVTWGATADALGYDLSTADGSMAMAVVIYRQQGAAAWPVCG